MFTTTTSPRGVAYRKSSYNPLNAAPPSSLHICSAPLTPSRVRSSECLCYQIQNTSYLSTSPPAFHLSPSLFNILSFSSLFSSFLRRRRLSSFAALLSCSVRFLVRFVSIFLSHCIGCLLFSIFYYVLYSRHTLTWTSHNALHIPPPT